MYCLVAIVLLLVWPAVASVYFDPTIIFNPDTPVEVVLDRDNYTQILVRDETNVKLDCSFVRSTFIADNGITNDESVTTRWLLARESANGETYYQPTVLESRFSGDILVSRDHLNITRIRLPTLAVDGTTGEYTCEVCHNRGMQNNGKICVNSTVPIRGRRYPPDIQDGARDGICQVVTFFDIIVICNVGTNYCFTNNHRTWTPRFFLLCDHNSTAPRTPSPQIGVWFINGEQVSSADGNLLRGVSNSIILTRSGRRLTLLQGAPRGNYTCQLTNIAGMDTATSIITNCNSNLIDLQVTLPQSTLNVTRIGAGRRPEAVAIQAGLDVMLYCPSTATNTTWFKRRSTTSQPVLPSTNHISLTTTDIQGVSTVVLSIQGLRDEDFGEYVCVATNEAGRDEASATLTELGAWSAEEWSSCTRRRTVRCVGASGRPLPVCSGERPPTRSTCTNCQ